MLTKNLDADADEDDASQEFRTDFPVHGRSESHAQMETQDAHEEGDQTDGGKGRAELRQRLVAGAGIAYTYGQGIDAGGNGQ